MMVPLTLAIIPVIGCHVSRLIRGKMKNKHFR